MRAAETGGDDLPPVRRRRDAAFALLLLLAIAAALPAVMLKLQPPPPLPAPWDGWLEAMRASLVDIRFGSGLRFWLGVAGTALMLLPLLYPLRKLGSFARLVRIGAWFDLHVVAGLFGPLLILYHCNGGLGSRPANVALATMTAVVASGLVGHFVFARISSRYYRLKAKAGQRLASLLAGLQALPPGPPRDRFIEELHRFADAGSIDPAGPAALPREQDLTARAQWLAASLPVSPGRAGEAITQSLAAYFAAVKKTARWQRRERLWRGWRLMHLPVFAIMVVATGIHVTRVWDMGAPAEQLPAGSEVTPPSAMPASPGETAKGTVPVMATRQVRTLAVDASDKAEASAPVAVPPQATVAPPRRVARPSSPVPPPPPVAVPETPSAELAPRSSPAAPAAASRSRAAAPTDDPGVRAIAQLERRNAEATTGTFEPAALAEKLRKLKAERFDHGKTRFPLTGLHVPLKCESCHKTTLKDTDRACVACHKKDDVHRGRRPDCAQCHVTDDWSRIVRRR